MVFEVSNSIEKIRENGVLATVITSKDEKVITNAVSAQALITETKFETGSERIAIAKNYINDDFFTLSTGVAEAIVAKFANFHTKLAIYDCADVAADVKEFAAASEWLCLADSKEEAVAWLVK